MSPVMRPCLVHGCRNLIEAQKGGPSRCPEHQRDQGRRHYENTSPGTTSAWAKTVRRIKRRAHGRCERCGKPEAKQSGRSTHQVHHLDGGGIRSETTDDRLLYVCQKCHFELHGAMRESAAPQRRQSR